MVTTENRLNVRRVSELVATLSLLRFFPSSDEAFAALVKMACENGRSEAAIRWAVETILKRHKEWPGSGAFYDLLLSPMAPGSTKPLSAIDRLKVTGGAETKLITDGSPAEPMDQKFAEKFNLLYVKTAMPKATPLSATEQRRERELKLLLEATLTPPDQRPPDPPPPPPPTPQIITAGDCAEAVKLNHERGLWQHRPGNPDKSGYPGRGRS